VIFLEEKKEILALVLGGGKGTRMKSGTAKVLQPVIDVPMLFYSLEELKRSELTAAVVVGHQEETVKSYIEKDFPGTITVTQKQQLGTGHAVTVARKTWQEYEHVLVMPGDIPLLKEDTIRSLVKEHLKGKNVCTFLTFKTEAPTGYGRISRDDPFLRIVEESDASDSEKLITEVNSGVYLFRTDALLKALSKIDNTNSQNEFYLTDTVSTLHRDYGKVSAILCDDPEQLQGVNSSSQLAEISGKVRKRIIEKMLDKGVKITDPDTVHVSPKAEVEEDVYIEPFVQILGSSYIGRGTTVGSFSQIKNTSVGADSNILNHAIVHDSFLKENVTIGPFCYIRNSSTIEKEAYIGKFVEVKKSTVGKNSKVPHLSYIGDAEIGEDTNIGAGTITCNYDGQNKNRTKIGNSCFIGSDTMLVAPVNLEDRSFTAAGSVITSDVPEDAMAIARAKQRNIEDWTSRRQKRGKGKNGKKGAN
jgi:bifunctional UDP-N-acetylglucosamine pyrophosphorylase/glucosamine-1-phosphate N-acetyltransferase